ncbi:MAG: hypothetical protein K9I85_10370 [Saprospiraceae bacterium]|nr:hypothetical protein [Saprospiraceae bacterium]
MIIRTLLFLALTLLFSCQSEQTIEQDLAGDWNVRVSLSEKTKQEVDRDLSKADMDLEKAKKEIRTEVDEAKEEIRKSLDENGIRVTNGEGEEATTTDLSEGLEKMVEGIGQMVEGIAGMGVGLGTAITRAITEHLEQAVTLLPDGTIEATSRNGKVNIDINDSDNRWKVEDGKFILYGDGSPEVFDIKSTSTGFDLIGKDVILHLQRPVK